MKLLFNKNCRAFHVRSYPLWIRTTLMIVAWVLLYPLLAPSGYRYSSYSDILVVSCNLGDW